MSVHVLLLFCSLLDTFFHAFYIFLGEYFCHFKMAESRMTDYDYQTVVIKKKLPARGHLSNEQVGGVKYIV